MGKLYLQPDSIIHNTGKCDQVKGCCMNKSYKTQGVLLMACVETEHYADVMCYATVLITATVIGCNVAAASMSHGTESCGWHVLVGTFTEITCVAG